MNLQLANAGVEDRSTSLCVIGGGPSGLAVTKNLAQAGLNVECLERRDDFGGNWHYGRGSSVYRSTHLISSKRLTEFPDFPMPDEWPPFPSHERALEYLRAYARHFDLYRHTEFQTEVRRVEPEGNGAWLVSLANGQTRRYGGLVIANGHHWDPRWPTYPGKFDGTVLHSCHYKTPEVLRDKRVLVVGGGNSGCDIAVEAAQNAARTFHSTRRGYHYLPKFVLGKPSDVCGERLLRWGLPLWLRRTIIAGLVKLTQGSPQDFGLPKPDHRLLETHPIVNSQLLYFVGHGDITPKPDVAELCGDRVRFVDGSDEQVDVIVFATGFNISMPFIDPAHLNWHGGCPRLYLGAFHPRYDNLFVAGLIQPDSGLWGLVDCQAQLIARFLIAQQCDRRQAEWFRRQKAMQSPDLAGGIRYIASPRHALEVEHYSYRKRLERLIAAFGR